MIFGSMTRSESEQIAGQFVSAIDTVNGWDDGSSQKRLGVTLIGLAALVVATEDNPQALDNLARGIEEATSRIGLESVQEGGN